jgi:MIP family channel proteins
MYNLTQKLTAEFLGTFALIFFGAGAVCVDFHLRNSGSTLGLLGIALAHGMALAAMVAAFGGISGGHFNPAVTIGYWVTKRLTTLDTLAYWAAQLVGAVAAAFLLKAIVPGETWSGISGGRPDLMPDFPSWAALALEATATFFMVLLVFATIVADRSGFKPVAPFSIGLTYALGVLVAYPFTGGALNPARAFGPALASGHWHNQLIYWVGPLGGGFLAGLIYETLFLRGADA